MLVQTVDQRQVPKPHFKIDGANEQEAPLLIHLNQHWQGSQITKLTVDVQPMCKSLQKEWNGNQPCEMLT